MDTAAVGRVRRGAHQCNDLSLTCVSISLSPVVDDTLPEVVALVGAKMVGSHLGAQAHVPLQRS